MPGKVLPPTQELQTLREQGLTCEQIADEVARKYHVRVTGTAISMALLRAGYPAKTPRYAAEIPWRVRPEHNNDHDVYMLRVAARVKHGKRVSAEERRMLDAWRRQLDDQQAVVHYHRDHGFMWVPRRPGVDTGLIREPQRAERSTETAAAP
jgi:hypothetical protein